MKTLEPHAVVLLIDHVRKSLLPLNRRGIERTQKSRIRLKSDYPQAEILSPSGDVWPVQDFLVGRSTDLGLPWPLEWLSFTGERYLTLVFGPPRAESVERIKELILDYLSRETHRDEWTRDGETWDAFLNRVRDASTHRELFDAMHLTSSEDGLDVFS